MNCDEVRALVYDYLDGQLQGMTLQEMVGHLEDCRMCFPYMEFHRIMKALLKKAQERVQNHEVLRIKVLDRLRRAEQ